MFARPSVSGSLACATLATLALLSLTACSSSSSGDGAPAGDSATSKDSSVGDTSGFDSSITTEAGPDSRADTAVRDASGKDGDSGGPTITTCDMHTGDECNMVKQDCAADETCDYSPSKGHNACAKPPIGVVGKGEACDPSNPCDRGLFCYDGKCSPPCCTGDNSVCGGEGKCNLSITEPTDGGADKVLYHVCTYPATCHAFKYDCPKNQVCLWATEPDSFSCATPTSSTVYKAGPEGACKYANDCGESQICTALTTSGSDAGAGSKCYLFCYLSGPEAGSVGTTPDGRFPANGTCTVAGKSYGTCTSITGIGGGLGLCVRP